MDFDPDIRIHGLEGPFWLISDFEKRWRDERQREDMLWVLREISEESSVLGASAHILGVARRPEE